MPQEFSQYDGPTRRAPLGTVAGARSGDKGTTANVGVWAKSPSVWPWLASYLTAGRCGELLGCPVVRHEFPNLHALNFVGEGMLSPTRFDPQGKGLGEQLRAQIVDVPLELL